MLLLLTVYENIEKGEVFYAKRSDNTESDAIFPKQSLNSNQHRLSEDVQARLDSMLGGTVASAAALLSETHILKLNHAALKSTFIARVTCGERHVLFLTSSGFVYSMGSNELGQLGNALEEVE